LLGVLEEVYAGLALMGGDLDLSKVNGQIWPATSAARCGLGKGRKKKERDDNMTDTLKEKDEVRWRNARASAWMGEQPSKWISRLGWIMRRAFPENGAEGNMTCIYR